MSKMSFSFSLNVMLSMSKMLKIDQIHLRAVMLCMSKMSKMGKEHTHTFLYRVCDMSKVSEMSFSFSLNVILSMSKIDQIHLRAVIQYMSKTSKMGKEHTHIFAHNFLNIQPIFNLQKVWKAETKSLPYHQILCIIKHVEDVKDNLRHLQHASTYIGFEKP